MIFFVYPMWDSESQRIGKQKCSAKAYSLHVLADYIGFVGLLLLIGLVIAALFKRDILVWWYFLIPFLLSICGWLMLQYSWYVVLKKGFKYNYEKAEASWVENGANFSYKYEP